MAAEKKSVQKKTDGEELVTIRLHKDNDRYKSDVFVAVNGERVQIKRGVDVTVPRKFAKVLERSQKQEAAASFEMEKKSAQAQAQPL